MKQFWLIRHGQSTANVGQPIAKRGIPPLTDLGWQQAHAIAEWFPTEPDLIVATPFVRAQQTAEPLRARFPSVDYAIWEAQEYSPLNKRWYTNTRTSERSPLFLKFFDDADPHHDNGDGAETFAAGIERAGRLLKQLHEAPQSNIVVFTHGTFLRMVYWRWLMKTDKAAYNAMGAFGPYRKVMRIPNCSVIYGEVRENGAMLLSSPEIVVRLSA